MLKENIIILALTIFSFISHSFSQQLEADIYGNLYKLNRLTLEKTSTDYDTVYFDMPESSHINSFDITNPMRILVFSKSRNSVQFLDNSLSPVSEAFNMSSIDIYNCSAACSSSQGGFWLFDEARQKIIHVTESGETDIESGRIEFRLSNPSFIKEHKGQLFLGYKNHGILVFNAYGAYIKNLPFAYNTKAIFRGNNIFYDFDKKIYLYNTKTLNVSEITATPYNYIDFTNFDSKIFFLTDTTILIRSY